MTETLAYGYSFESTQRELPNEYQHDSVWKVFKDFCILESWTKVASALKGLKVCFCYQNCWFAISMHLVYTLSLF